MQALQVWGVKQNRSYVHNQAISLGLIFACGTLVLLSLVLTGANRQLLATVLGPKSLITAFIAAVFFKIAALGVTILYLFLVYWFLVYWRPPNTRISAVRVVPVAILVGVLIEVLKYVTVLAWPFIDRNFTPSTARSSTRRSWWSGRSWRRCWCWAVPSGQPARGSR